MSVHRSASPTTVERSQRGDPQDPPCERHCRQQLIRRSRMRNIFQIAPTKSPMSSVCYLSAATHAEDFVKISRQLFEVLLTVSQKSAAQVRDIPASECELWSTHAALEI